MIANWKILPALMLILFSPICSQTAFADEVTDKQVDANQASSISKRAGYMNASPHKRATLPDSIEKRSVVIWSDGTRMAADLYLPKGLKSDEKLPAVVFCNGTGGTKDGTATRLAPLFVERGYAFLAFDYRGWGSSDCKLMLVDSMPAAGPDGNTLARVKPIKWQLDFADQTYDIRSAISFLSGEPNVDANRIGIMGSSYGGGLVTWVAANDPRVKCVVAQVPGMGGNKGPAAIAANYALATKQARGETEPVPIETGKLGGDMSRFAQMRRNPVKSIGYSPIGDASKINIPMMIVVAEKDELVDNNTNGKAVYDIVNSKGNVPVSYHMIKEITHFDVYTKGLNEASTLELKWYDDHLKNALRTVASSQANRTQE